MSHREFLQPRPDFSHLRPGTSNEHINISLEHGTLISQALVRFIFAVVASTHMQECVLGSTDVAWDRATKSVYLGFHLFIM